MTRHFVVAIRNDQGQVLVLETLSHDPVFPGGVFTDGVQLRRLAEKIRADTGLELGGLHQASVSKERPGVEVYRFTAFISAGTLVKFPRAPQDDAVPPSEGFRSASWIAPGLVAKLQGATTDMKALAEDLAWTYQRPAP